MQNMHRAQHISRIWMANKHSWVFKSAMVLVHKNMSPCTSWTRPERGSQAQGRPRPKRATCGWVYREREESQEEKVITSKRVSGKKAWGNTMSLVWGDKKGRSWEAN